MKLVSSVVAVAILSATVPAQGATTDPLKVIYRVSGVRDSGSGAGVGVATSFHCSNFGSVAEIIRIVVRHADGGIAASRTFQINSGSTFTASTHATNLFSDNAFLAMGEAITQGLVTIQSTSLQVHCSAMIVDATASVPQGIALHMVRVNPVLNTQE